MLFVANLNPSPYVPLATLIFDGLASPARNMAIDEALLARGPRTGPAHFTAGAYPPSASATSSPLRWRAIARSSAATRAAVWSITPTTLHYTIVLPRAHPWLRSISPRPESYCTIHKRRAGRARPACGIESELTPSTHARRIRVLLRQAGQVRHRFDQERSRQAQRGAAQRRTREGLLHQGSILLPDPAKNAVLRRDFAPAFARRMEITIIPRLADRLRGGSNR